jgi:predicted DNA-binding antitoxin AbrB/MazE fold protein
MTITVDATYANGVFRPKQALTLPEGAEVRLAISAGEKSDAREDGDPLAGLIGTFATGRSDGAANHDKYIYGEPRS